MVFLKAVNVFGSQSKGDQINHLNVNSFSVFDVLKEHMAVTASYDSRDSELEHASVCQEGTREDVLKKISAWSRANTGYPVCWLEGPAGSGKSTIARAIAQQCDGDNRLVFSFFFSRSKKDRSNLTKFVPTFAHQLAKSFPAVQPSMLRALKEDPSILHPPLRDQIEKLVIRPVLGIPRPIQPTIIVIDALDESSDNDLLRELILLLVDSTNRIPFRFLFTSRPELHIRQTFESPSTKRKAYFLSLRDFRAHNVIHDYLRLRLSEIHDRNDHLMRDVPRPWPSPQALEVLVDQSDGLFVYVSTLVRFVADMTGLPQERLQAAMTTHRGVDSLYHQVLSVAQKFKYFERVIGTIIYLRHPLTISELGQLLWLQPSHIHLALHGCQAVLAVPDSDQESVHLYHASLRDFLTDRSRGGEHFLDPQVYHVSILASCLQVITRNENHEDGNCLPYACQNWCHHFSMALSHHATIGSINANCDMVMQMKGMEQNQLRVWMYGLGDFFGVETVCTDCESVVARMVEMPVQWMGIMGSFKKILGVLKKLKDSYIRRGGIYFGNKKIGYYGEQFTYIGTWKNLVDHFQGQL